MPGPRDELLRRDLRAGSLTGLDPLRSRFGPGCSGTGRQRIRLRRHNRRRAAAHRRLEQADVLRRSPVGLRKLPREIDRYELATHRHSPLLALSPPDSKLPFGIERVLPSEGATAYAYDYLHGVPTLYLVDGLR